MRPQFCPFFSFNIHPSIHPSICPSIHPSVFLFIYPSTHLFTHPSIYSFIYSHVHPCASIHPVNQQSHLSESGLGNRCMCSTPGAATTAPSGQGDRRAHARGLRSYWSAERPQAGAARAAGALRWSTCQDLFSVKIQRKAATTGYHSFRGGGVEGGGVYNKVLK